MQYVGVDLHKHRIVLCVTELDEGRPKVVKRQRLDCGNAGEIRRFFAGLGPFQVVVEATAAYEWFFALLEPLADRLVLAHPKKLRIIAESTRKTDRIDAEVLATFLALDMIPQAYRPTPRIRAHRTLVRHRCWLQQRITSLKCKIRNLLGHHNADIPGLFTRVGEEHLAAVPLSGAERVVLDGLRQQLSLFLKQRREADRQLALFAEQAPLAEQEARAVLDTIPRIGPVTIDVLLSELGDWRRFKSAKAVTAFSGLEPGIRSSAGKRQELHITKEGSRLLRWVLIQAAWRLIVHSPRWRLRFERLWRNTGSRKKAVVAVARLLLGAIFAMLRDGSRYQLEGVPNTNERREDTSARARQKGAAPSRLRRRLSLSRG